MAATASTSGANINTLASNTPSLRLSNPSVPSVTSEQGTPREQGHSSLFRHPDPMQSSHHGEARVFLQPKPQGFQPANPVSFTGLGPSASVSAPLHDGFQAQHPEQSHTVATATASQQQNQQQHNQDYYSRGDVKVHPSSLLTQPSDTPAAGPEQELPPYDLLYALVELYFKQIHTWCPILHRKTTFDAFFGGHTSLDEADRVLLHAIVATTLRFSQDARLTEDRKRHYHDLSKRKVLLYGLDNLSVKSLQALVILALDLFGSSHGPPSWNIMALITRAVVQIGLAVESSPLTVAPNLPSISTLRATILPEPRDFIEEESRRRLFWMVYLLDRYATIVTAFDFALGDRDIERKLPCRDELWAKNQKVETRWYLRGQTAGDGVIEQGLGRPENLGAFAYYIDILSILSQIHLFLKEPVDISAGPDVERWQRRYKELDSLLSQWQVGLPAEFGSMGCQSAANKAAACSWVMLQTTFHTTVIRLHSSAAYPTMRSAIFAPSYGAMQRCQVAVENIAAIYEYVNSNGLLDKLGPPFAFSLWVAARLLLVHASTMEHPLSPNIAVFLSALREMGRYWQVASRYSQLLQRVLDEYRDSERKGDGVTPKSVKILADMRRTAFDLEWLISHQPRHPPPSAYAGNGGGGAGGSGLSGAPSRMPSLTPARTPAPNELEYLDVFNWFNYPRVPPGGENALYPMAHGMVDAAAAGGGLAGGTAANGSGGDGHGGVIPVTAEYINFGTYAVDATRDWLGV